MPMKKSKSESTASNVLTSSQNDSSSASNRPHKDPTKSDLEQLYLAKNRSLHKHSVEHDLKTTHGDGAESPSKESNENVKPIRHVRLRSESHRRISRVKRIYPQSKSSIDYISKLAVPKYRQMKFTDVKPLLDKEKIKMHKRWLQQINQGTATTRVTELAVPFPK